MKPHDPADRLDEICNFAFNAFDPDNNGKIEFSEFLVAFSLLTKGDLKKKLEFCFEIYDIDNNGYITKDELAKVLDGMYDLYGIDINADNSPDKLANEIFVRSDKSKDGKLSKDEFISAVSADPFMQTIMNPFD